MVVRSRLLVYHMGEWVTHQKSSSSITVQTNSNSTTFSNPTLDIWNTPGTVLLENVDQDITLEWSSVQYDPLEKDERILRAGYRRILMVFST